MADKNSATSARRLTAAHQNYRILANRHRRLRRLYRRGIRRRAAAAAGISRAAHAVESGHQSQWRQLSVIACIGMAAAWLRVAAASAAAARQHRRNGQAWQMKMKKKKISIENNRRSVGVMAYQSANRLINEEKEGIIRTRNEEHQPGSSENVACVSKLAEIMKKENRKRRSYIENEISKWRSAVNGGENSGKMKIMAAKMLL